MEQTKFSWALNTEGKLVHISQVERGRASNCFCPYCKAPLVAKKGSVKAHHFAHSNDSEDCKHGYESAVHLLAKAILKKSKTIALPPYEVSYDEKPESDPEIFSLLDGLYGYQYAYHFQTFTFDEIQNEVHLGDFIPDSIAVKNETKLLVEFRFTHAVDEDKFEKIRAKGLSCIEIDISDFRLSNSAEEDSANMERFLAKEAADHSKWIFNSKVRELVKEDLGKVRKERAPELAEQKRRRQWADNTEAIVTSLKNNYHNLLDISRQTPSPNDCIFTDILRKLAEPPYGKMPAFQKILYKPYSWNGILYHTKYQTKKLYFSDEERPYYISYMIPQDGTASHDDIIKRIHWAQHEILDREKCVRCPYAKLINTYGAEHFYYTGHAYIFCTRIEVMPDFLSYLL